MYGEMLPVENLKYWYHSAQHFSGIWHTSLITHIKRKKKKKNQSSAWIKVSAAGITKGIESLKRRMLFVNAKVS